MLFGSQNINCKICILDVPTFYRKMCILEFSTLNSYICNSVVMTLNSKMYSLEVETS